MHKPVLLQEAVDALCIKEAGIYVDATFGRGGHSKAILQRLGPQGKLLAIDKDPEAVEAALADPELKNDRRFTIQQGSYVMMENWLQQQGYMGKVNGLLFDLGVSSPQLDDPKRGFSFLRDGPLDMRMDLNQEFNAETWINTAKESVIAEVLKEYGEERFAKRLAKAIITARKAKQITSTKQLAEIIAKAHPKWERGKNPATRSFQGIRIFINRELEELEKVLSQCVNALATGGRLCVITFHSLEDRIVKQFLQRQERGEDLPREVPVKHQQLKCSMKRVGKAICPSSLEVSGNPRARSAKLRVGEKL